MHFLYEEVQNEFAWKLVHGSVFRQPRAAMFLSVCVGIGTQIGLTVFITLGTLLSKLFFHIL